MTTQTTPTPESVKALADGLTKAENLLSFVATYQLEQCGRSPSVQEMADHLGTCKSEAFRVIGVLEAKGRIRRIPGKRRTLQLVDATLPPTVWTPISYVPPNEWVLVTEAGYPDSTRRAIWWQSRQQWAVFVNRAGDPLFEDHIKPTHWAPLPHVALVQQERIAA